METNVLFPVTIPVHIVLALLAVLIFGIQFIRLRKKYYIPLIIAFPITLIPYVVDNMTLYYIIGIISAACLVVSLILSKTVDRVKDTEEDGETSAELMKNLEEVPVNETAVSAGEPAAAPDDITVQED